MKRSHSIRLFLLGGLSSAALAGCDQKPSVSAENVYTNNFFLPGTGYYHAPFRNWYALPYNHFDPQRQRFYYGGQWGALPYLSITNISSPTPDAVQVADLLRTDISRGGFGTSYGYHSWGGWGFHSY